MAASTAIGKISMEVKEYKIWRFAYKSHEDKIYVPEGVKFYCFDKEESRKRFEYFRSKGSDVKYPNLRYVAVLDWSEEIERMSHCMHYDIMGHKDDYTHIQSWSLKSMNLNNRYMIWYLDQVCPMTDDFPETDELPKFDPQYFKVRDMDGVEVDAVHTLKNLSSLLEDKLSEEDFDKLYPINEYFRLDEIGIGGFKGARVVVRRHQVRNSNNILIESDSYPFQILDDFPFCPGKTRVESSTKEEFRDAMSKVLNSIGE